LSNKQPVAKQQPEVIKSQAARKRREAKQPEVNKFQAIRDMLEKNPPTPIQEIVAALAQQGIQVSDTYVYMVHGKRRCSAATL